MLKAIIDVIDLHKGKFSPNITLVCRDNNGFIQFYTTNRFITEEERRICNNYFKALWCLRDKYAQHHLCNSF